MCMIAWSGRALKQIALINDPLWKLALDKFAKEMKEHVRNHWWSVAAINLVEQWCCCVSAYLKIVWHSISFI